MSLWVCTPYAPPIENNEAVRPLFCCVTCYNILDKSGVAEANQPRSLLRQGKRKQYERD